MVLDLVADLGYPTLLQVFNGLELLENLYLSQNLLESIPDVGNATQLRRLNLDTNKLVLKYWLSVDRILTASVTGRVSRLSLSLRLVMIFLQALVSNCLFIHANFWRETQISSCKNIVLVFDNDW